MKVTFDPFKRATTLAARGLDFADAAQVFDGPRLTIEDVRFDYREPRLRTYGFVDGRMVAMIWTPTDDGIRVISMRHCHDKEQRRYRPHMG